MREIKFRAWYDGKMHYQVGITTCSILLYDWGGICSNYIEGTDPDNYTQKCIKPSVSAEIGNGLNIELMQYTGLKDKNGKEVYEGDIIEYNGDRGTDGKITLCRETVEWKEELAGFRPAQKEWYNLGVEVVGNVHENPK